MIISALQTYNYDNFLNNVFDVKSHRLKQIIMYYLQTNLDFNNSSNDKSLVYMNIHMNDNYYREITSCKTVEKLIENNFIIRNVENIAHDLRIYNVILQNGTPMKLFMYDLEGCAIRTYAIVDDILDLFDGLSYHIPSNTLIAPKIHIPYLNKINYFKNNQYTTPKFFISSNSHTLPQSLNYGKGEYVIVDSSISENLKYTTLVKKFDYEETQNQTLSIHRIDNIKQFLKYLKLTGFEIFNYYRIGHKYFLYTK